MIRPDWLNANPIFFDSGEDSGKTLSEAGLSIAWKYGYSAFGLTPDSSKRFLLPWEGREESSGAIVQLEDPVLEWSYDTQKLKESEILESFRNNVLSRVCQSESPIVVPLSGGMDSRLILWALRGVSRSRIFTYSYGVSYPQQDSSEVLRAQEIAAKEKVAWSRVPVGNFWGLTDMNYELMGVSAHAHSMYHIEFFQKIRKLHPEEDTIVLSGSVGDAWAGSVSPGLISSPKDLVKFRLSHGLHGSSRELRQCKASEVEERFFETVKDKVRDPIWRTVFLIQNKMMLLRYLHVVPVNLGFVVETPFHEKQIALSMAALPRARRLNRIWQTEFLESVGMGVSKTGSLSNSLLFQAHLTESMTLPEITGGATRYFDPDFLAKTSRVLSSPPFLRAINLTKLGGAKKSALLNLSPLNRTLSAIRSGMLLDPILRLIKEADAKASG
jgi:hypothetical protein